MVQNLALLLLTAVRELTRTFPHDLLQLHIMPAVCVVADLVSRPAIRILVL